MLAGILVERLFNGRPDSAFAASVSHGRFSRRFRDNQADAGPAVGASETIVEATYADQVAPHLVLRPDVQWVHRPSGQRAIRDAAVVGLRVVAAY